MEEQEVLTQGPQIQGHQAQQKWPQQAPSRTPDRQRRQEVRQLQAQKVRRRPLSTMRHDKLKKHAQISRSDPKRMIRWRGPK